MKNRLLFSIMISALFLGGSMFARYCDIRRTEEASKKEAVSVMSYVTSSEKKEAGVTVTDLAKKVEELINGGASR